ncbi:MAG TPA: HYR domain-containing protein, partial [Polyangiaceae bacterium]|nr:HYR domain-containing protein [Polyangiaceae bacterium]
RDTNAQAIPFNLDYAAGGFTLYGFTLPFAEGHATVDLTGSFATRALLANAGADQTLECQAPEGAVANLTATSTATSGALYSWWRGDALDTANQLNPGQFSGPGIQALSPLGTTEYAVGVMGDGLAVASDKTSVSVQDTTGPLLQVEDVIVECSAFSGQTVPLPTPSVADVCDTVPTVTVNAPATFPLGDTTLTWLASDASGNTTQVMSTVRVQDTTPPQLSLQASPNTIWSPNGKFVAVHVNAAAQDVCDANVSVKLISVTATEPGVAAPVPAGEFRAAGIGTADFDIELRARRRGQAKDSRIYELVYEATDASNNKTLTTVQVTVPHSAP